jgi:hypothetical protein
MKNEVGSVRCAHDVPLRHDSRAHGARYGLGPCLLPVKPVLSLSKGRGQHERSECG